MPSDDKEMARSRAVRESTRGILSGSDSMTISPPVPESGISKHETTVCNPATSNATRWNAHLRFFLTTGLRFSAHSNDIINNKKGDIFIELTKGIFLSSFDNVIRAHVKAK
jgi:hypothetical protein